MSGEKTRGGPVSRVLLPPRRKGAAAAHHLSGPGSYRPGSSAAYPQAGGSLPDGPSTCCSALLLARFTVPPPSPAARWALTPPFHPHRRRTAAPRAAGSMFSVALSVRGAAPPVSGAPAAARELPGAMPLRSPDFPPSRAPTQGGAAAAVRRPASVTLAIGQASADASACASGSAPASFSSASSASSASSSNIRSSSSNSALAASKASPSNSSSPP